MTDPAQVPTVEARTVEPQITVTEEGENAERIYMSISFVNISRDTAERIFYAAREQAGQTSFSVYYDKAQEFDAEE
jgi:hypothetical protein